MYSGYLLKEGAPTVFKKKDLFKRRLVVLVTGHVHCKLRSGTQCGELRSVTRTGARALAPALELSQLDLNATCPPLAGAPLTLTHNIMAAGAVDLEFVI